MPEQYETNSEKETFDLAERLAAGLAPGSFVALYGGLGAGKTAFTKGLAHGLGVREGVVSPTFTFLRVYETGRLPLYHFDMYRISSQEELDDIGFFDYATGDGVCVCEWADLIQDELPGGRVDIRILAEQDGHRKIMVEKKGA